MIISNVESEHFMDIVEISIGSIKQKGNEVKWENHYKSRKTKSIMRNMSKR